MNHFFDLIKKATYLDDLKIVNWQVEEYQFSEDFFITLMEVLSTKVLKTLHMEFKLKEYESDDPAQIKTSFKKFLIA